MIFVTAWTLAFWGMLPLLPGSATMIADHPATALISQPRVLIIGHRGSSQAAPENTLPAFRLALDAESDLIELDYYHSSDGVPLAFHDDTLDRTTNAVQLLGREDLRVAELPWVELQRLDAGGWFSDRYAETRIPTLEESIELIQTGSVTLIERKGGDAATCIDLLRRRDWLDQVVVQAFDWDYVRDCHRLAPELALGALGRNELTDARLDSIESSGAAVVGWRASDIRQADIPRVHARGLKLWIYTVNDREQAQRLMGWGVDGLITDVPGEMREWLRAH